MLLTKRNINRIIRLEEPAQGAAVGPIEEEPLRYNDLSGFLAPFLQLLGHVLESGKLSDEVHKMEDLVLLFGREM